MTCIIVSLPRVSKLVAVYFTKARFFEAYYYSQKKRLNFLLNLFYHITENGNMPIYLKYQRQ